ncbi:hypothetical protein KM043_004185 [Ampulex compressa]|nr:hypothetical protein KM043_004185 [Ampulex compressa]
MATDRNHPPLRVIFGQQPLLLNGRKMVLTYIIVALLPCTLGFPQKISIGGLFDGDHMIRRAFELSIRAVNRNLGVSEDVKDISLLSKLIQADMDLFHVADKACLLLRVGVAGIFGPQDKAAATHVQSMCDTMDIPHITARWEAEPKRGNVINLYPHSEVLSTVYQQLVEEFKWENYAVLYDNTDSLIRLNRLLQLKNLRDYVVTLYHLGTGPNFRETLQDVKASGVLNIVIDCSYDNLAAILEQAQQVGIMSGKHSIIIGSLDLQTLDLEPYQYSGVNLTGVRLIDPESPVVQRILGARSLNWNLTKRSHLRVEAALTYDAVQLFAAGYARLRNSARGNLKRLLCNDSQSWEHGYSLSNFMRAEEMSGLTGVIRFDTQGFRSDFSLDIVSISRKGLKKIGTWNGTSGIEWIPNVRRPGLPKEKSLQHKHFIVLISLTDPYGMLKESANMMTGNERYEGFAVDIIQEMSKMLGFNYTFEVQEDNVYGSYQKSTGQWNGMLRKIIDGDADLAITDLTITAERESAVDFTSPFMNLGISVLYRKPTRAPPSLLSFLLPFSKDIWVHLIGAYVLVTILLFIIGRLCPTEWTNPYPCIKEPEVLETPFTPTDTPFFVVGSLLKSPTGFAPAGISTRTMATAWWFFCLIMTSTYTANLAAALSTKSVVWPFKIAEDLAHQDKIKYGAKKDGSTILFFRNASYPAYEKMYRYMRTHSADVLTESNEEGLKKVQQENYAFFMESTSIEYFRHRHCNVTQVGGLLDAKSYGIAMRKDAFYRNELSGAILKLKENGILNELQDKWWRQKRGGDQCQEKAEVKVEALNFEDVGGIFLILVSGVMLSWLYTGWSLLWHVRGIAIEKNTSFKKEIIQELKFLLKCSGRKLIREKQGPL